MCLFSPFRNSDRRRILLLERFLKLSRKLKGNFCEFPIKDLPFYSKVKLSFTQVSSQD